MIRKTLSVQQPWSYAIIHLGKDVENREWWTKLRGEILIHAGKKIDRDGYDWMIKKGYNLPPIKELKTGGIVGITTLYNCVTKCNSAWFFGRYGFMLKNSKELKFVPCIGQLGFFEFDYEKALAEEDEEELPF